MGFGLGRNSVLGAGIRQLLGEDAEEGVIGEPKAFLGNYGAAVGLPYGTRPYNWYSAAAMGQYQQELLRLMGRAPQGWSDSGTFTHGNNTYNPNYHDNLRLKGHISDPYTGEPLYQGVEPAPSFGEVQINPFGTTADPAGLLRGRVKAGALGGDTAGAIGSNSIGGGSTGGGR